MDRDNEKDPVGKPNPLIERQIDEILRSSERTYRRRMFWNRLGSGFNHFFRRLGSGGRGSPYGRLMLWGLLLVLAGVFVSGMGPIRPIASLLVLGGIIMFISPIFMSFRRSGGAGGMSSSEGKYWRGRPLNDEDPWQATKQQFSGMMRWLRGGDKNPPPRR